MRTWTDLRESTIKYANSKPTQIDLCTQSGEERLRGYLASWGVVSGAWRIKDVLAGEKLNKVELDLGEQPHPSCISIESR